MIHEDHHHHHEEACEHCHGHEHQGHEEHEHGHEHHHEEGEVKESIIKIVLATVLLVAAVIIEKKTDWPVWAYLLVYLVPYLIVGWETLTEAAEALVHGEALDENFLMAVATLGALAIGFLPGAATQFPEAVFVMLFFQVGELFEGIAEGRSRKSIAHLMDIRPDTAHVERDGGVVTVSPETIAPGEVVLIQPGEKVPMDGVVLEGRSNLDTVALTGESVPRSIGPDDEVLSGCVNLSGVLRVRATKAFGESTASKILDLVENAAERKSRSESFITKFAKIYTPIVVGLAVLLAVVPSLVTGEWATWIYRALMFLVVSCPCALVISVPLTFFGGIGGASRKGILVKGANFMDTLSRVRTVVFDKTGTLTEGVFEVTAVHPELIDEKELLHLAAHVERHSTHPIAAALRLAYPDEQDDCLITDIVETAGHGVTAMVNGKRVAVGNEKHMAREGAQSHPCELKGTIIHVSIDGVYAGHIVISDRVKADAAEAVAALHRAGVRRTVMLTGDEPDIAAAVATAVGVDTYHAGLLPADKVTHVEALLNEGRSPRLDEPRHSRLDQPLTSAQSADETARHSRLNQPLTSAQPADEPARHSRLDRESPRGAVAFVGDGINDAPVLARADLGIAMGALGSDAAIEAADVVLMDDKPSKVAEAVRIARRTLAIARENMIFAIGIKILVLLLAAFGLATLWMAVFADVGVTVLAVLNAMRALKV